MSGWAGGRAVPVRPVILRGEQPGSKPTTPKPKLPRKVRPISRQHAGQIAGYADEHGFDVPDTRGWTTEIGTDFLTEMVETGGQDRWSD